MEIRPLSEHPISGFLHVPDHPNGGGMVLTHGAGGSCGAPLLVAVANALASDGMLVLRCDLPFRQKRRLGPPFPAQAAEDRAGLFAAAAKMRQLATGRILLAGHSYGGRQASLVCAEASDAADGLLLLSYPLHPPKKPDNLRTAHFPDIRTPALFVHGTKDPFGSMEEMQSAVAAIPSRTAIAFVPGAGHDLLKGRFDINAVVVRGLRDLR